MQAVVNRIRLREPLGDAGLAAAQSDVVLSYERAPAP
jgi:hypothetical protein